MPAREGALRASESSIPYPHPDEARWYVIQVQPHQEALALSHLRLQGYRAFCPRIRKTVSHAGRKKQVLAPLFSGYLFLNLDIASEPWRSVNGTRGVVRLIMRGEFPAPVPRGAMDDLMARLSADGSMDGGPVLKVGEVVRIANGPFEDFIGTLEYLDGAGRARVLLELLGRSVSVVLNGETLAEAA